MRAPAASNGSRLCPHCGYAEPIADGEVIWSAGWRCKTCGEAVPIIAGVPSYAIELANTLTGFDPSSFDRLAAHEAGHYWFEPRNRLLTGLAQRFFPSARHYLEIGCGTGFVLDAFARSRKWASITGAELHPSGLNYVKRRLSDRAFLVQMDARHIPARGAFDLIGAFDVLEHIEEDEAVIVGIYDALAPGGGFMVSVPQHPFLWSVADDLGHHVRRYRRGEMEAKLERAGFEIVLSTSYTTLLLPLMIASRFGRKNGNIDDFVQREFAVSAPINWVLRAILRAEVFATLKGATWPFGGSRIVVARKSAGPLQ